MNLKHAARVEARGGFMPGPSIVNERQIIVAVSWADSSTVEGLKRSNGAQSYEAGWHHTFTGNTRHVMGGHDVFLNTTSVLELGLGTACLIGASDRLIVNAETGAVQVTTTGPLSPSAPAAIRGETLLVPEGRQLSRLDTTTLNVLESRPVPGDRWILGPSTGSIFPIQTGDGEDGALWDVESDRVFELGRTRCVASAPVVLESSMVVATGGGAADELISIDRNSGSELWACRVAGAERAHPPAEGPFPVPFPAFAYEDTLLVLTADAGLESRSQIDGSLRWRIDFPAEPACGLLDGDWFWAGRVDGGIYGVDVTRGMIVDQGMIDPLADFPVSIFHAPPTEGISSAYFTTRLGSVWQASARTS